MKKKKEIEEFDDIFLEKHKIPDELDGYFKAYTQTGDYEELTTKTRKYIAQDTCNVDIIIHNLRLEKNKIEIDDKIDNSKISPVSIAMYAGLLAIWTNVLSGLMIKDYSSEALRGLTVGIMFLAFFICMFLLSMLNFREAKADTAHSLYQREKCDFLDFCISEYQKKQQCTP